jgi:predicted small metal-binding protein
MRVIECNHCGEAISAASDQELAGRLAGHMRDEHDQEPDTDEVEELVADEAYDALDS